MSDVLAIANDRRDELKKELARMEEFIRMGESLLARPSGSQRGDSASPLVLGFGEASGVKVAGGSGS